MPRTDWEAVRGPTTQLVTIAVEGTPMKGLAREASLIGAVASRSSSGGEEVAIYRYDPLDAKPINTDRYVVLTNLTDHPQLDDFITAASTARNPNLDKFLADNVLLIKTEPGRDHWISELPSTVRAVLDWTAPA